jgi:hypothetical protein
MAEATAPHMPPAQRRGIAIAVMAFVALGAWVSWMVARTVAREDSRSRMIFEQHSAVPAADLRHCLESKPVEGLGISQKGGAWHALPDSPDTLSATNPARHFRVDIVETGAERILRFYARDGARMYPSERSLVDQCLALPPG